MSKLRRKAKHRINREFLRFKREKLFRMSKEEVRDTCHMIHFYSSVREYFCENEKIPRVYLELAVKAPALIQNMWDVYLKQEELQYQTWDDIDEILEQVTLRWSINKTA